MVAINEDYNHGMEYFCQYDRQLKRYVALSACGGGGGGEI